jgi:phospholipase D1/2
MGAIRTSILAARSHIYITDWIMSVDLLLLRDGAHPPATLLDLLSAACGRSVDVRVSLYESVDEIRPLDNGDAEAEKRLLTVPGLRVQRHRPSLGYSHHEKIVVVDGQVAFLGGIDLAWERWDTAEHPLFPGSDLLPDDDFLNPGITAGEQGAAKAGTGGGEWREVYPRMPWEDVHLRLSGPSVRDVGRCFEQRWNFIDAEKYGGLSQIGRYADAAVFAAPPADPAEIDRELSTTDARVQILRSAGPRSHGVAVEASIADAYMSLIEGARTHVYIENQFFISNPTAQSDWEVRNNIAAHLLDRVRLALREGRDFRIDIVLPLHSMGDIRDLTPVSAPQRTGYHQNRSLFDGPLSLAGEVARLVSEDRAGRNVPALDPQGLDLEVSRHLGVYCLRNWAVSPGTPGRFATDQVYVHTKLLVVDDSRMIVGSANFNDRSLLGTRDSEIALLLEDGAVTESVLAGVPAAKGSLPFALRRRLWTNHWGIDVEDPLDPAASDRMREIAAQNAALLAEAFPYAPSDRWRDLDAWNEALRQGPGWHGFGPASDQPGALQTLRGIQGRIHPFPRGFLADRGWESGWPLSEYFT